VSRIDEVFQRLKAENRMALIPFLTAGDPTLTMTRKCILEMERNGADIVELGVPFSDPLADGPTIQRSAQRALAGGTSLTGILDFVREVRRSVSVPIVLMGYYNPVYHYGVERFVEDFSGAGGDGIIVPDLPPEEAEPLIRAARRADVDTIFLLAPTSTRERIERVAAVARGFIYYVSLTGVTGARTELSSGIEGSLEQIREVTSKPVCVGFGISRPEHVRAIRAFSDGAIVGSAVVEIIEKNRSEARCEDLVGAFIRKFHDATIRD